MTEFEKRLFRELHDRYAKKADELVNGTVSDVNYRAHVAYLAALRDILKVSHDIAKSIKEGK